MSCVKGISHIAFNVSDLDRSVDFYCSRLGFRKAFGMVVPDNIDELMPGTPLGKIKGKESLVYIQAPDGSYIELFRPLPGYDSMSGGPNYERMGYVHLSLQIDDLQAFAAELRKTDTVIDSEIQLGPDNTYTMWIKDPDGNRIELMEYTDKSFQVIYKSE